MMRVLALACLLFTGVGAALAGNHDQLEPAFGRMLQWGKKLVQRRQSSRPTKQVAQPDTKVPPVRQVKPPTSPPVEQKPPAPKPRVENEGEMWRGHVSIGMPRTIPLNIASGSFFEVDANMSHPEVRINVFAPMENRLLCENQRCFSTRIDADKVPLWLTIHTLGNEIVPYALKPKTRAPASSDTSTAPPVPHNMIYRSGERYPDSTDTKGDNFDRWWGILSNNYGLAQTVKDLKFDYLRIQALLTSQVPSTYLDTETTRQIALRLRQ